MKSLAICIPTYNRAEIVRDTIHSIASVIPSQSYNLYVSDNASTDGTAEVLKKLSLQYPMLNYQIQPSNRGMDANFEAVMAMATEDYIWLLGDDDQIDGRYVNTLLTCLDTGEFDCIVLNGGGGGVGRVRGNGHEVYSDPSTLLADLGWHMTWISSLVISRKTLMEMDFKDLYGTLFSHFISLFRSLAAKDSIRAIFLDEHYFSPSDHAEFNWGPNVLDVFGVKFVEALDSLPPAYRQDQKNRCLILHGKNTRLFTLTGLLNLRSKNWLSKNDLTRHKTLAKSFLCVPYPIALVISLLPINFLVHARAIALWGRHVLK